MAGVKAKQGSLLLCQCAGLRHPQLTCSTAGCFATNTGVVVIARKPPASVQCMKKPNKAVFLRVPEARAVRTFEMHNAEMKWKARDKAGC